MVPCRNCGGGPNEPHRCTCNVRKDSFAQALDAVRYLGRNVETLESTIRAVADQLDRWADESEKYGWSTHQVEPQRELAAKLRSGADVGPSRWLGTFRRRDGTQVEISELTPVPVLLDLIEELHARRELLSRSLL